MAKEQRPNENIGSTNPLQDFGGYAYQEGILHPREKDHPATGRHRTTFDLAIIEAVDIKRKMVRVRCLRHARTPTNVEWTSVMFDGRNGNGVYYVPKPGMVGIFCEIDAKPMFIAMTGSIEGYEDQGYTNSREDAPPGSFVNKTSRETKYVISPNLILLQAANFCKLLMKRISKALYVLFYNLELASLGGNFKWLTDVTKGISNITFSLRDHLPVKDPPPDQKIEAATRVGVKLGEIYDEKGKASDDVAYFNVALAKGDGEDITTEEPQIKAWRRLVYAEFNKEPVINSRVDLEKLPEEDPRKVAFLEWTTPRDLTQELCIESIVDSAAWVDRAHNDALNGVKRLLPEVASWEAIGGDDDGKVSPVTPETVLNPESAFAIQANPVENKKDPKGQPTIADPLTKTARACASDFELDKLNNRLVLQVQKDGKVILEKDSDITITSKGDFTITQEKGKASWTVQKGFTAQTKENHVALDSAEGLHIKASKGQLLIGNGLSSITICDNGTLILSGRMIVLNTQRPRREQTIGDRQEQAALAAKDPASRSPAESARLQELREDAEAPPDKITTAGSTYLFDPDTCIINPGSHATVNAPSVVVASETYTGSAPPQSKSDIATETKKLMDATGIRDLKP